MAVDNLYHDGMRSLPLRTPSLVIRHLVPDDAQPMLHLNGEETTRKWLPSHVYADGPAAARAMAYLIGCYARPGDPRLGAYVLGVEDAERGVLLGHVGFSPLDDDVEISYAIAEHARSRGLGTEAVIHACTWVSGSFGLPRIVAITDTANIPSRRMLERAGFRYMQSEVMRFQGMEDKVVRRYARSSDEGASSPGSS
jgi:RimJ/RimL family protein N-acetyltransferase